jgi:transglutaminase-like putative cysteine protease
MTRSIATGLWIVLVACLPAHAAERVPDWLRTVAATATAQPAGDATVLLDEIAVTVAPDGRLAIERRYAARIHTLDGKSAAGVRAIYLTDSDRIRQVRGWLLAGGRTTELGDADIVDVAADADDVYNDVRVRSLDASGRATAGAIFGAEIVTESRSTFLQFEWTLQGRWAVDVARRTLTLPPGWTATSVTFNHAALAPTASGATQTWEVRGLPEIRHEALAPALSGFAPRLALTVHPAPGTSGVTFRSWPDVSGWVAGLAEVSAPIEPAVTAKAKELVTAARSDIEKITAIARYVQGLQYISIQTGVGRGGGYRPRTPSQVLSRGYGDCKDKANLMRALLAAVGVRSHLVLIYSGDRRYVRREWPSPQQFNHCILAIVLSDAPPAWTTLAHPEAGRVLFFDPTDPHGALGGLPDTEQGSFALLALPGGSDLVTVPTNAPESEGGDDTVDATLRADGGITARVSLTWRGQAAVDARARLATLSATEYREGLEARFRQSLPGAVVRQVETRDDPGSRAVTATFDVEASSVARSLAGLFVLAPVSAASVTLPELDSDTRRQPIELSGYRYRERVRITLPDGFAVDELPSPIAVERAPGRYSRRWRAEGSRLESERALDLADVQLPAGAATDVRAFTREVREADAQPVILKRASSPRN